MPLPWSGTTAPYGWVRPWLPQPDGWAGLTVEAQSADPASTLSLHRAAAGVRRAHPALGAGGMRWLAAPAGCLVLARDPGFVCAVNLGAAQAPLPAHREVLLASGPLDGGRLPPDTAAWLAT